MDIRVRTIKLKIPKNIVELANKVYDEDNYEPLTKKEIALVLSNFYDNYGYFRREEKLCVQLFARCMKDNINCETLIDAFNKYCKVSAYFNYVPEMEKTHLLVSELKWKTQKNFMAHSNYYKIQKI